MANKNFTVKNGLEVGGQEVITSAGVLTNSAFPTALAPTFTDLTLTGSLSGTLASSVTGTTQSAGDNSTKIATTAYIATAVANLVDSSPTTLDTLNELAAALGDDPNFATTTATAIGLKAPIASPAFNSGTGNVVASFTSTDTIAAIQLVDNNGNVEIGAVGNDFHVMNAGGAAKLVVLNSGNVGIGVTNPGQTLEIHNSDASDYTDFALRGTGHKYVIGVGNDSVATVNDKWYLYDNDNTAFRMVVDTSGNVGIGTSTPSAPLHVDGADMGNVYSGIIQNSATASGNYNVLRFMQGSSGSATGYIGTGGSTTGNPSFRNSFVVGTQSNNPLVFNTNDAERMRIDSVGSVGIGVTPSTWASTVYDALQIGGSIGVGTIAGRRDGINQVNFGLNWNYDGGATLTYVGTSFATNYSQEAGTHRWSHAASGTAGGALTLTESMRIDASGNVGIGTSNAPYKLVVSNAGASGIEFGPAYSGTTNLVQHYNRSGASYVDVNTSAAQHKFYIGPTFAAIIDASGNVGIGETNPKAPGGAGATTLTLKGTDFPQWISVASNSTANSSTWRSISRSSNVYQIQTVNDAITTEQTAYQITRGDGSNSITEHRWFAGNTEAMRIDYSGVLTSKSHVVTGIDNNAFEVKTNHSGNPSALRVAGTGSINGIAGSFQNFYVLNVMQDSGSQKSIYAAGDVRTDGNLVIGTAGKGIAFNVAGGTGTSTSGTLDDYEEGTWTPVVSGGAGTVTASSTNGYYTKVGNLVTINGTYSWSANGNLGDNTTKMTGFPFANHSDANGRAVGSFGAINGIAGAETLRLVCDPGYAWAYIIAQNGTGYSHHNTFSASGNIYGFTLTYMTA
jgi:hypothetical protein